MVFKVLVARNSLARGLGSRSRYLTRKRERRGLGMRSRLSVTANSLIGRVQSSIGFSSASAVGMMSSRSRIVPVLSFSYMRVIVIIVALLQVGNSKKLLCKSCGVKNCFTLSGEFVTNRIARELFMSSGGVILKNLKEIVDLILKGFVGVLTKNNLVLIVGVIGECRTVNILENNLCNHPRVRANCYIKLVGLKGTPARIVAVSCMGTRVPIHDCMINVCELLNRHCSSSYYNCYVRLMGSCARIVM